MNIFVDGLRRQAGKVRGIGLNAQARGALFSAGLP
jgi:hypothetical protein